MSKTNCYKYIEKVLFFYKCFLFKVEHNVYNDVLNQSFSDEQNKEKCRKVVNIVNDALNKLDKSEKELIEHVYIKGQSKNFLPYSIATFYNKRNRALEKLYYLLGNVNIEEILQFSHN